MGFFSNLFEKKENKALLEEVTLFDCVDDLLNDTPQEVTFRRAKLYQKQFERLGGEPGSYRALYFTLMHYYKLTRQDMNIVANNIISGVYNLIGEAQDRDPYQAKRLFERLFAKWPEAFQMAQTCACKEETEKNLVFLACVCLFEWEHNADISNYGEYVDKLSRRGALKKPEVYEWLKAQIKE